MRTRILILLALTLTGCAHATIHDYCVENAGHYATYDECYAETAATGQNKPKLARVLGAAAKGMSDGMKASRQNRVECTSTTFGNITDTSCQ